MARTRIPLLFVVACGLGVAVPALAQAPTIVHRALSGELQCGANAGGIPVGGDCPAGPSSSNTFGLTLEGRPSRIELRLTWTPASTLEPRSLRLAVSESMDKTGPAYLEGPSPLVMDLTGFSDEVDLGHPWQVEVTLPRDASAASATWDQAFGLDVTEHYGLPESEDTSTQTGPGPAEGLVDASSTTPMWWLIVPMPLLILAFPGPRRALWAATLALFTRLDQDRVLDHPRRALLHSLVRAQPGTPAETMRARAGLATGAFEHHVQILERHGFLHRANVAGRVFLFPAGDRTSRPAPDHEPQSIRLLEIVAAEPGQRQIDLARRLNVPEDTIRYHATKLARRGRLRLVPDGRAVRCFPA